MPDSAPLTDPAIGSPAVQREAGSSPWLWLLGLALIGAAIASGMLVEDKIAETGTLESRPSTALAVSAMPYVFAFGFSLGMALLALAAQSTPPSPYLSRGLWLLGAAAAVASPILIPAVAGRELDSAYFGVGGIAIATCTALSFWLIGRLRQIAPADLRLALDLALSALLCFALAAWNLCGSAAMPSFLLEPERVLKLGTQAFAIGQMKTVMALLVAGWATSALAGAAALSALRRRS